jgi:dephospho-CoA kinase
MSVPIIGILGGIGSGKSSVVREVTEFHLQIIDADRIGHDLLENADVLRELHTTFETFIFDSKGDVIRPKLAEVVFGETAKHQSALHKLNQILHPAIRRETATQITQASQDADAVIIDAALLLEAGWTDPCDVLVYIDTPESERIARVQANRNWSARDLRRREQTQLPLDKKRALADYIVDNSGPIANAAQQMTEILRQVIADAAPRPH